MIRALLATLCLAAGTADAHPSIFFDVGWHGQSEAFQVHAPTVEHHDGWVSAWFRSPVGPHYGQWLYSRNLVNCHDWTLVPFTTVDEDGYFALWADVLGREPQPVDPQPGSDLYNTVTAVCGLYGYSRQTPPHRFFPPGHVER